MEKLTKNVVYEAIYHNTTIEGLKRDLVSMFGHKAIEITDCHYETPHHDFAHEEPFLHAHIHVNGVLFHMEEYGYDM